MQHDERQQAAATFVYSSPTRRMRRGRGRRPHARRDLGRRALADHAHPQSVVRLSSQATSAVKIADTFGPIYGDDHRCITRSRACAKAAALVLHGQAGCCVRRPSRAGFSLGRPASRTPAHPAVRACKYQAWLGGGPASPLPPASPLLTGCPPHTHSATRLPRALSCSPSSALRLRSSWTAAIGSELTLISVHPSSSSRSSASSHRSFSAIHFMKNEKRLTEICVSFLIFMSSRFGAIQLASLEPADRHPCQHPAYEH